MKPKERSRESARDDEALFREIRVAVWYVLEEIFGGLQYDELATPYWSNEIEALDERLRKRLRLLSLADDDASPPEQVKEFVTKTANLPQLMAVAEEAVALWGDRTLDPDEVAKLKDSFERAFRGSGVDVHFDSSGKLVQRTDIDTAPKAIADLPKQPEFKADLSEAVQRQIALVFIDLDNFKAVNDTKGHQAGDECLAKVAETIGGVITGKGKLYRYGGDEFAVILRNADVDEAAATGERIRSAIRAAQPGGDIEVTASIGVAASDQAGRRDAEMLLKAADDATYASKRGTKNCVTKWDDATPTEPDNRTTSIERIKRLIELAECGVHEIQNNRRNLPPDELSNMRHEWENAVLAALEAANVTQSEMSSFRVLGTYKTQVIAVGPYKKIVNEVVEKINRLRQIIEQLETRQRAR